MARTNRADLRRRSRRVARRRALQWPAAAERRTSFANFSGGACRGRRRRELGGHVAVKDGGSDMIEPAVEIGPDLAADIGPAFAEREILAQIGAGGRIDHAFEQ